MIEVISVRFRGGCKTYYFDPQGIQVQMGDNVVVQTAQGLEFATCTQGNHEVSEKAIVKELSPMLRMATEQDRKVVEANRKKESEAFDICEKKIAQHKLDMKLTNVSASFDGNKVIFFFTADGRVDFRELVRDLAGVFRARIELRQIGVRDEAKMIGGLGICGRPFCCSTFLEGFVPVSIKMAKTQNLSLNPAKISGTCGRLMCCLKYEQNAYEDAMKRMPKNDSFVMTPDGPGNVRSVDLLREKVKVSLDEVKEAPRPYRNSEIEVLRNGKGSRDGIEVPTKRPARFVEADLDMPHDVGALGRPFYMNQPMTALESGFAAQDQEDDKPRRPRRGGDSNRRRKDPSRQQQGDRKPNEKKPLDKKPQQEGKKPQGDKKPQQGEKKPNPQNRRNRNRPQGQKPDGAPKTDKPQTQPQTKPQPKPQTKPDTKPDTKPQTKPDTKPQTQPKAEGDAPKPKNRRPRYRGPRKPKAPSAT